MVHECDYIYETGRKCRRIPKRGESLCPGHRPHARPSFHSQPDFARQLMGFTQQLRALDLPSLLAVLQDSLIAVQPIVERKSSRATYTPFARALVALTVAFEAIDALRRTAAPPASHAAPYASPRPPF